MYFSQLGVVLISVKPLTTEITENKTTPKFCKITVILILWCCHGSIPPEIEKIATQDKMVVEGTPTSVAYSGLP